MLLTASQANLFSWAVGAVIFAAFAVPGIVLVRRDRGWGKLLVVVGLIAGFFAAVSKPANGSRVLIVRVGADGQPVRDDRRVYGSAGYRMSNGAARTLTWNTAAEILVNDTPAPLVLTKAVYGVPVADEERTVIDPFQVKLLDDWILHFGPNDQPPSTSYELTRYWLHW